ncbi:MAG: hypothetical protein DMF64_00500 [Acidobacteria bacterium]|nr:MAG: hypothetical protein DMF64_00500 [Acidobacteriota bacterium]
MLQAMTVKAYRFVTRPSDARHGHPMLVFDRQDRLHVPLTIFTKEAGFRVLAATVRNYLYAILPFFQFLELDEWQVRAGRRWDGPSEQVRIAVTDYLTQRLQCKVREHRLGFQRVFHTRIKRDTIGVFLSGLKLFYRVMSQAGFYGYNNPLVDSTRSAITDVEEILNEEDEPPRIPAISGVVESPDEPDRRRRLSDSYFKLEGEQWVPQVIDDESFPARVHAGGRLIGWRLREQVVICLLFDTGARISEVVGLTLGDWHQRGLCQEVTAFSKGSHGRRVKFLRFSKVTQVLLRRYFNGERKRLDPHGYTLKNYTQAAKRGGCNLYEVPLFLTTQRTALTPKTFRDLYWNPACAAVGLVADVHQTRHWFVTRMVRLIHEGSSDEAQVKRKLRELIEYMKWRSGWETLEAYDHFYDPHRVVESQDKLHALLAEGMRLHSKRGKQHTPTESQASEAPRRSTDAALIFNDPEFDFLRQLGG